MWSAGGRASGYPPPIVGPTIAHPAGRALLAALALTASGAWPRPAAARDELVIGLIPETNVFRQKARFQALGEELGRTVGVPIRFTVLSRYGNILERFESGHMDGAFFGSFTGALAIERLGVIPLARPLHPDGVSTYHGLIFVRRDGGIRTAADMRGKRMAFVDRATTAGYLFPVAWLRAAGARDPLKWFRQSYFTGSHDAAIAAVLDGDADVGAAKNTEWERLAARDPRVDRELLVLARSGNVPSNGLCVRKDLEAPVREALRQALLGMHLRPEGARALAAVGATRFIETSAADYAPVREMAEKAGLRLESYRYRND